VKGSTDGSRRPKVQQTSGGPPMTTEDPLHFTSHHGNKRLEREGERGGGVVGSAEV